MTRYTTFPGSWVADDLWDEPSRREIFVCEAGPVDTGLIDRNGNRIMRVPVPIGFGRDAEW